jgi:hypothetical protein
MFEKHGINICGLEIKWDFSARKLLDNVKWRAFGPFFGILKTFYPIHVSL